MEAEILPETGTRYLIRQPKPIQWAERGQLFRRQACGGPRTGNSINNTCFFKVNILTNMCKGPFELFLDLVYVSVVANFADHLAANLSGHEFIKYIVLTSIP